MTHIVYGIVKRADGRVLFCQRQHSDRSQPGLWEVPGGKVEPGENPCRAVAREVDEETGLAVIVDSAAVYELNYPDSVASFFSCTLFGDDFVRLKECDGAVWLSRDELRLAVGLETIRFTGRCRAMILDHLLGRGGLA